MNAKLSANTFAKRLIGLRKERGWSQPELGKKIGTSGAIIGRYERGEMLPSIEVARKLAEALGATVDFLINENGLSSALQDRVMLERWDALNALPQAERNWILVVVDALIRDVKSRQTYSGNN